MELVTAVAAILKIPVTVTSNVQPIANPITSLLLKLFASGGFSRSNGAIGKYNTMAIIRPYVPSIPCKPIKDLSVAHKRLKTSYYANTLYKTYYKERRREGCFLHEHLFG